MNKCPQEFIDIAQDLLKISGEIVSKYFRSNLHIESKSDLSPVTIADKEIEEEIRSVLSKKRPNDGIIGEEYGKERENAELTWVLDPIDGTRAFAAGKPLFGTLIALLENNVPILGVIDHPILKERWVGAVGHETKFNDVVCKTRKCDEFSEAVVNMGAQAFPYGNSVSLDAYRRVDKAACSTCITGDCYVYGLISSGHLDFAIEHDLKLYDFAALVPVVEGAGGVICDWQGRKLNKDSRGQIMVAGDQRLIDEAVILLDGVL